MQVSRARRFVEFRHALAFLISWKLRRDVACSWRAGDRRLPFVAAPHRRPRRRKYTTTADSLSRRRR